MQSCVNGIPSLNLKTLKENRQTVWGLWFVLICILGTAPGTFAQTTGAVPLAVIAGQTIPDINFSLAAGGKISGTVSIAAANQGISSLKVYDYDTLEYGIINWSIYATTNSFGVYTDADGQPLADIEIHIFAKGPFGKRANHATTAYDVSYSVTGLPSGDYRIYADLGNKDYAGTFPISNVQAGDSVKIQTLKTGYSFPPYYMDAFANAVTERFISGILGAM